MYFIAMEEITISIFVEISIERIPRHKEVKEKLARAILRKWDIEK